MRRAISTCLMFLSFSALAKTNYCEVTQINADKKIKISGVPGFFFKVHPDGETLSYIGYETNVLINLNDGTEHALPGNIDGVWAPDGAFLTTPGSKQDGKYHTQGIQVYPSPKIIEAAKAGTIDKADFSLVASDGVYQSIGKVGETYRMINDQNGVSLSQFSYQDEKATLLEPVKRPCSNIQNLGSDLPMISKDGKFLSVYNKTEKKTKIYKFKGEECSLALDLGMPTAKVSFNKDSSQIAFHIEQFGEFESGYFSGVTKDKLLNVVVLNLSEEGDKLVPTSWAMASEHVKPGDGGYYPDFDREGNLYFMEDIDNNYQIVKVSPKKLDFYPMFKDLKFARGNCDNCEAKNAEKVTAVKVLSKLWAKMCPNLSGGPELIAAMNPESCRELVDKFWTQSLGVTKTTLAETCPGKKVSHVEVGVWDPNQKGSAEHTIKGRCITCHTAPFETEVTAKLYIEKGEGATAEEKEITIKKKIPALNLDKLDMRSVAKMLNAIESEQMPKGDKLSPDEKKLIKDYLKKKVLDLGEYYPDDYLYIRLYPENELAALRKRSVRPEMKPDEKKRVELFVNCYYGQKSCKEMITSFQPLLVNASKKLDQKSRAPFIADMTMKLKCMNLFQVTTQQCLDWDARRDIRFEEVKIGFEFDATLIELDKKKKEKK